MTEIAKLSEEIILLADESGLVIRGFRSELPFNQIAKINPTAEVLLQKLPGLISTGYFKEKENELHIDLESLHKLETEEDPFDNLLEWANCEIKINSANILGFPDFAFRPRFYSGNRLINLSPIGVMALVGEGKYKRLTASQAESLQICKNFNSLIPRKRDKGKALLALGKLQKLSSKNAGIALEEVLADQVVIVPQKVDINVIENGEYATAVPYVEGVDEKKMATAFCNFSTEQNVYDLEANDGKGRQRIVFDEKLLPLLKAMKENGEGLRGKKKIAFQKDPRFILPEDENVDFDLVGYGPRVVGFGIPKFVKPFTNHTKEDWFGGFECEFADGKLEKLEFKSKEEAVEFVHQAQKVIDEGETILNWAGKPIPVDEEVLNGIRTSAKLSTPKEGERAKRVDRTRRSLIIYLNEAQLEYAPPTSNASEQIGWSYQKPRSLKTQIDLKKHQVEGVSWLQNLIHNQITYGGLLADEMGLGKTLQLLTFAAWLIEAEKRDILGANKPPYEPILIIAPLGLISVWENEINNYFDESVFQPRCLLHGSTIKNYRKTGNAGKETELGQETLDLELLKKHRLIITNYDTVKNYQYSLGKIDWSLVIVDEAQEIKEPSTATTHAIKALKCHFAIASTGTPVETNLINLWSIMDFVNPGNRLGCLSDFKSEYSAISAGDKILGKKLRTALGFNEEKGLVIRRTKKEVLKDLPEKELRRLNCALTEEERSLYFGIVSGVRRQKNDGIAALNGLQQLQVLSQHPSLLKRDLDRLDVRQLLTSSNKLKVLVDELRKIKTKGEKALVFARTLRMQDILKLVIDTEFNMNVDIVNGSTATQHQYVLKTRAGVVDRFSQTSGFNVIILSPEVAGVGLTITAANHVFHYGRWWNPAKENQATDRAYRIGQTKKVYVYQLIGQDPRGEFETFDQKLDRLIQQREALADNFLSPDNFVDTATQNMMNEFFWSTDRVKEKSVVDHVSLSDVGPYEFEAMVGLLLKEEHQKTCLTPKSHDGGVDVIAQSNSRLILVQCKKTNNINPLNLESAIDELIDGLDHYRNQYFPVSANSWKITLLLATNGLVDTQTQSYARNKNVEIIDKTAIKEMLARRPITRYDLLCEEEKRFKDLEGLFANLDFD